MNALLNAYRNVAGEQMGGTSRGKKTDGGATAPRKSSRSRKRAQAGMVSPPEPSLAPVAADEAVAVLEPPVSAEPMPLATASDGEGVSFADAGTGKAGKRKKGAATSSRSRKSPQAKTEPVAGDETEALASDSVKKPSRKPARRRKQTADEALEAEAREAEAREAEAREAEAREAEAREAEADKAFADALADAFIAYAPADGGDDDASPPVSLPFLVDPADVAGDETAEASGAPVRAAEAPSDPQPEPQPEPEFEPQPEPEPWVDLVLEPTPRKTPSADEWVDQVLEPVKLPLPSRPPRARVAAKAAAKSTVKASTKATVKGVPTPRASVRQSAPTPARAATASAQPVTRWWLVVPLFLVAAILLFVNRPGKAHAPVPASVIGTWTTAFWLYENQMLEIKRDTVVATLDEPEEGRYPITKVETSDAGRETAVKITYRLDSGDEKVLDFLADKDPTTALRFRAHSGLVWVRPQE